MMNATVQQQWHNVVVKPACQVAGHFAMPLFVPAFGFGKGQFASKYRYTSLVHGENRG